MRERSLGAQSDRQPWRRSYPLQSNFTIDPPVAFAILAV
jgi:hypothetical protein